MRCVLLVLLMACGSGSDSKSEPNSRGRGVDDKPAWTVDVPRVKDVGLAPYDEKELIVVTAMPTGLTMEGQPIVGLKSGELDPADLEGGRVGMKIAKLSQFTKALLEARQTKGLTQHEVGLLFDRTVPYRTLISTMYSMKTEGVKKFHVVGRLGDDPVAVPITLPDKAAARTAIKEADIDRMIASVSEADAPRDAAPSLKVTKKSTTPASSLTPDLIAQKTQTAYARGLQRCTYGAKQTVQLGFTVDRNGSVLAPKITGTKGDVADCIGGFVGNWRFPRPKSDDGEPIDLAVQLELEIGPLPQANPEPKKPTRPMPTPTQITSDDEAKADPAPAGIMMKPESIPLQLIVSVTKHDVILWSMSQLEGSLRAPRFRLPMSTGPESYVVARQLGRVLREIVDARWGAKDRAPETRTIILQAAAETPMQVVAELMFAMRQAPDRTWLFPDIVLSTGFE